MTRPKGKFGKILYCSRRIYTKIKHPILRIQYKRQNILKGYFTYLWI